MKARNVIEYYSMCKNLKNTLRSGWTVWNVQSDRIESVAEHIYGVLMLAIAMYSEYKYDIDIKKVIDMLALHELEEIYIGDLTLFEISNSEKKQIGHEAVDQVIKSLDIKDDIKSLILEFDEGKTKEARFAFQCDKLEADLQAKVYDEAGCVDINNQPNNKALQDEMVQELLQSGKSWSEMWSRFSQDRYNYDEHFLEVSNYAINNQITKKKS